MSEESLEAPRPKLRWKPAPLLPRADARDGALIFVVAVLSLLACLTIVAALSANRAASGWQAQLQGSATVLVRPKPGETADAAAARATEVMADIEGVDQPLMMEPEKAIALIKPWLGEDVLTDDLPIPRLVTLELDPRHPATADTIRKALAAGGIDATVDDHSVWVKDIVRSATIARLIAFSIFLLLFAATASVIVFATRAALEARRELVLVLHHAGAEDDFIASLFQARFGRMAAIAGAFGAAPAIVAGAMLRLIGGGHGLTPVLPVAWTDLLAPAPAPLIAAVIAMMAARATALRIIGRMQ